MMYVFADGPIYYWGKHRYGQSYCECLCGNPEHFLVRNCHLVSGHRKSCGCRRTIHGETRNKTKSRIFCEWWCMIQRCTNPKLKSYERYGKRGITVCERWLASFLNFLADMGPGKKGWTIHRVDNDKGYFLENVVWATPKFQSRHMSSNRVLTVRGKTACLTELAEDYGIKPNTVGSRLAAGWEVERAFTTPLLHH